MTRNRGGVFAGLEEEGRSSGYFRRGSGLRASTSYGECFASVNLAGAALQWALHGELRNGDHGDRGWTYLQPDLAIQGAGEQ